MTERIRHYAPSQLAIGLSARRTVLRLVETLLLQRDSAVKVALFIAQSETILGIVTRGFADMLQEYAMGMIEVFLRVAVSLVGRVKGPLRRCFTASLT